MSIRFALSLGLALLSVACAQEGSVGTHIGNPGELTFRASSSAAMATPEAPTFTDDGGTAYTLTSARIGVRHIDLYLPTDLGCEDIADALVGATCEPLDDKIRVDGPFVLDLLGRQTLPGLQLPAITYRRIDYRIDDTREEDGLLALTDPLLDRSFVATASFSGPEGDAQLELLLRFNEDARVEDPLGVTLPEDGLLAVDFDVASWLQNAPIAECLADGDLTLDAGVLRIDEDDTRCNGIESPLKTNIKSSARILAEAR